MIYWPSYVNVTVDKYGTSKGAHWHDSAQTTTSYGEYVATTNPSTCHKVWKANSLLQILERLRALRPRHDELRRSEHEMQKTLAFHTAHLKWSLATERWSTADLV